MFVDSDFEEWYNVTTKKNYGEYNEKSDLFSALCSNYDVV